MVKIADSSGLKLASGPHKWRPSIYPMLLALLIGFSFSTLWLTVSIFLVLDGHTSNVVWGAMTGLCTLVYCSYMAYIAYKLVTDSQKQYFLDLTDSDLVLIVLDNLRRKKSTQMVLLDDIKYAEYYPYPDSSTVILHAPYTVVEIPLWPFGGQSVDVMDFLAGRGIPIVDVQFDDRIPE